VPRGLLPTGRVYLWIAKKGLTWLRCVLNGGEYYDLVRRSDGAVTGSFKLRSGDRVLLNSEGLEVSYKHLQADERVIARDTLVEIVRELSANN
jgi:hypothetical protein